MTNEKQRFFDKREDVRLLRVKAQIARKEGRYAVSSAIENELMDLYNRYVKQ